jgi:hypothetical protein
MFLIIAPLTEKREKIYRIIRYYTYGIKNVARAAVALTAMLAQIPYRIDFKYRFGTETSFRKVLIVNEM